MTDDTRASPVSGSRPARPGQRHGSGRLVLAGFLALTMGLAPLRGASQAPDDGAMRVLLLEQPFPYEAKDVALTEMLHEMSQKTGLPVIVGEGVSGRAEVSNLRGSVRDLLQRLAEDGRISWWFDGAAVHVEAAAMVSRLLPLKGVRPADLREALRGVGLTANEYPMLAEGNARMVRIVAPQGYVEAVQQTIDALAAELAPKGPASLPVIIRGPGRARAGGRTDWAMPPYAYGAVPAIPYPAYPSAPWPSAASASPDPAAGNQTDTRKEVR